MSVDFSNDAIFDIQMFDNDNNSNDGQMTKQHLEAELHEKRMMKSHLNDELNKNELFISNKELQQSIDYEVAQNMALQETLNSPQFKNSNKDRIELMKKNKINKVISRNV